MPFEHFDLHGRIWFHEDNWNRWRDERLAEYPCAPGKWRIDVNLDQPRPTIMEVPVRRNPHHHGHDPHYWFYRCANWSTIFGVHRRGDGWRMVLESGNTDPVWGERVVIYSTSSSFPDIPWSTNHPNIFAFFRGQFWQVDLWAFLHNYDDYINWRGCPHICCYSDHQCAFNNWAREEIGDRDTIVYSLREIDTLYIHYMALARTQQRYYYSWSESYQETLHDWSKEGF